MKRITNFGVMRGGIHVYLLWIINNCNDNEVLFYNNVRDVNKLSDRLVKKTDTRIVNVSNKILDINNNNNNHKIEIYSFESQIMSNSLVKGINKRLLTSDIDKCEYKITIVIRNPYNNFASLLKYLDNGGNSVYVKNIVNNEREFVNTWLSLAKNILKGIYIPVLYDRFIVDSDYRKNIASKLGIRLINNNLIKSKFGKGSSFGNNFNYNERYKFYLKNKKMQNLLNNKEVREMWHKIMTLIKN